MNDLFLFFEKPNLYNNADGNSLDSSSDNLSEMVVILKFYGRNAIDWFMKMACRPNPINSFYATFSNTDRKTNA